MGCIAAPIKPVITVSLRLPPTRRTPTMAPAPLGMSREGYDNIEAWNASLLKVVIKQTPAHAYQQFFSGAERPDSAAFRVGTMLHEAVLEPEVFARYITCEHSTRTKAYKEAVADAQSQGKTLAATTEHELACSMATAIRNHPILGSRSETPSCCNGRCHTATVSSGADNRHCANCPGVLWSSYTS